MPRKSALKAVEHPIEVPEVPPVEGWDDVDDRMLAIGRKDLEVESLKARLELALLKASEELTPLIKTAQAEREVMAAAVIEFAIERREEVEGKTWSGAYGKLTWPKESSAVVLTLLEENVIKKLRGRPELEHCIRVIEQVDKDALKALDLNQTERKELGFSIERKNVAGEEEDPPKLSIDKRKVIKHDSPTPHRETKSKGRR